MNKEEFYSRGETVERYERRRFGGKSGSYVNERELRTVLELLPRGGKLLDVPVGTGRLSLFLQQHGFDCHGIDVSPTMLELARSRGLVQLSQADIFRVAPDADSFDCAVSLRFLFHFRDVRALLEHIYTTLKPGGTYVFDTYNRSPRAWLPFLGEEGRVYLHSPEQITQLARAIGFEVGQQRSCYMFSPLLYRFLPWPVVQTLDRVERHVSDQYLARVFWQLKKPSRPLR
jgi:2-polyprenyl-3-methyl-5-hydroxy-6-metoxy-1,4-benzoquinol methylase